MEILVFREVKLCVEHSFIYRLRCWLSGLVHLLFLSFI
ncbi:MAG: hypothetical protein AVDCRST_MAG74-2457 [uncultured Pyrinomonadaceae bacterium]|uniref:Uncharacterized protein n=1 Tax=uncultured Pyrinomonadaceae bacterium TaxID=2283094 RepID=A0A6J4PG87_9BACT|nr:MAG: hypothetical protein AVDCRST_MAG74-2457 [uncultured Pyrinomonadaceae bacterium]